MDVREKLVELLGNIYLPMMCGPDTIGEYRIPHKFKKEIANHLIAHGVTVQEHCYKAESVISKTGLMCTACHSDIDRDAVFCKYCGAKVMPQPPKGE